MNGVVQLDDLLQANHVLVVQDLQDLDLTDGRDRKLPWRPAAVGTAGRRRGALTTLAARGAAARTPSFSLSIRTLFSATSSPVSLDFALYTCLLAEQRR